jgi:DNA-directed RNA polymerase specialized sigma24 family protein
MPKGWTPTQGQLDVLFDWLAADREVAGAKYEHIRQCLIKLFIWNEFSDAEDLADLTIDRVVQKLPGLTDGYVGDPALYFYGVAKRVIQERRRQMIRQPQIEDQSWPDRSTEPETDGSDAKFDCLEKCLKDLKARDRRLILQYYQAEKGAKIDFRQQMARRMNVDVNGLRVKMFRIRQALHSCIVGCLEQQPGAMKR